MKRTIIVFLIAILAVGMVACGNKPKEKTEYVSREWHDISFEAPAEWSLDKSSMQDDAIYYRAHNRDGLVTHQLLVTQTNMGSNATIDDAALTQIMEEMHDSAKTGDTYSIQDAEVNGIPAKKSRFLHSSDGVEYNIEAYVFPVGNHMTLFAFLTLDSDFSEFEKTISTISF